jgi:hypothetical protein
MLGFNSATGRFGFPWFFDRGIRSPVARFSSCFIISFVIDFGHATVSVLPAQGPVSAPNGFHLPLSSQGSRPVLLPVFPHRCRVSSRSELLWLITLSTVFVSISTRSKFGLQTKFIKVPAFLLDLFMCVCSCVRAVFWLIGLCPGHSEDQHSHHEQ